VRATLKILEAKGFLSYCKQGRKYLNGAAYYCFRFGLTLSHPNR